MPAIHKIFGHESFATYGVYRYVHIYSIKVDYVELVPVVTVGERVSVCRTSIFVVKALKDFVEQMSDHDDLLQSVCWTVSCVAFATDG